MLTSFSLTHRVAVMVFCLGSVILGVSSYRAMPKESFPDVKIPFVMVSTGLRGANPADIESAITIPLETELKGIEGLKEMRSRSAEGLSTISLEFEPEVPTEVSLDRVRARVDLAKGKLPQEADETTVLEISVTGMPVLIYNLSGDERVSLAELDELARKLKTELEAIPGVLGVDLVGARKKEIQIELDMERARFFGLSLAQAIGVLAGTNRNVSAGAAEAGAARVVVKLPGEFTSAVEIMDLVIGASPAGVPVHMRDVASVRPGFADETARSRVFDFTTPDGLRSLDARPAPRQCLSLQVKKRSGENLIEIARRADQVVAGLPQGGSVRILKSLDGSKQVKDMLAELENNIGTALILVLVVIFVAMGARNAVLVSLAIPFTMVLSYVVLHLSGQTLNMMVLFSLILALGMLTDDAIVILENIYRHHSMGKSPMEAALVGTKEMTKPVTASTLTTVGAFLPLVFWPGIMGEFMSFLPITVMLVLMGSLFVALTINPTFCAMFMRHDPSKRLFDSETLRPTYPIAVAYGRLLEWLLARPAWTLATTGVIFALSIALLAAFGRGVEFFPDTAPEFCTLSVTPPESASLEECDRLCRELEDRVFGKEGTPFPAPVRNLKHASVTVGLPGVSGGGGFAQQATGPVSIHVQFVDPEFRSEPSGDTLKELRARIEGQDRDGRQVAAPLVGAEFDVFKPQEGPPTGKPVSIDLFGEDLAELARVAGDMRALMAAIPGVAKPVDDAAVAQLTQRFTVDKDKAGSAGLSQAEVGQMLQVAVGGLKTGTFGHGDDEQDIVLRLSGPYRRSSGRLDAVYIPTPLGGMVPLATVASARLEPGPVAINRLDRKRVVNVGAEMQPGVQDDAGLRTRFAKAVQAYDFPAGVTYSLGGAAQEQQKASDFLSQAFVYALFIILMILVVEFNSVWVSLIVLSEVLMSLVGVFAGLVIFQIPFGIVMSGIGVISLAGIVVKNGIVLLDAMQALERKGLATMDAVVTASMLRFRPVTLTAVTTFLGLVPAALKFNLDFRNLWYQYDTTSSQFWQCMSLTIIFGLVVATILTLGVVPALYLVYARLRGPLPAEEKAAPAP